MRIKTVQVKRNNPLTQTMLRFFNIPTNKGIKVSLLTELWNDDITFEKIIMDNDIPRSNSCHGIDIVDLRIISEC